jgi:hypothetical protein
LVPKRASPVASAVYRCWINELVGETPTTEVAGF